MDSTFPSSQFHIEGFGKPYRLDRNSHGGGVKIYVRKDIPSKELKKHNFCDNMETIVIEVNFRKSKLLLFGTYHSTNTNFGLSNAKYFEQLGLALDIYCTYD